MSESWGGFRRFPLKIDMDSLCPTRGGMMGGVKAKNGVLELWSKGVLETRDAWPFWDAGPEAGVPTKSQKRSKLGKGGQWMGKWTGFSHFEPALTRLGPDDSMQVVDFPRMYTVSVFCEAIKSRNGRLATDGSEFLNFDLRILIGAIKAQNPDRGGRRAFGWRLPRQTVQLSALKCG
jgi:hypothetical protein